MYTVSLHYAERDARHLREAAEVIEARLKDRDQEVVSLSAKISELKDRVNEVCIIVLHFLAWLVNLCISNILTSYEYSFKM